MADAATSATGLTVMVTEPVRFATDVVVQPKELESDCQVIKYFVCVGPGLVRFAAGIGIEVGFGGVSTVVVRVDEAPVPDVLVIFKTTV